MTSTGIKNLTLDEIICTGTSTVTNLNVTGDTDIVTLNVNNINPGEVAPFDIQNGTMIIDNSSAYFGGLVRLDTIQALNGPAVGVGTGGGFLFFISTGTLIVNGSTDCIVNMVVHNSMIINTGDILVGDLEINRIQLVSYDPYHMNISSGGAFNITSNVLTTLAGVASPDNVSFTYSVDTVTILNPGFYMTSVFIDTLQYTGLVGDTFQFDIEKTEAETVVTNIEYDIQTIAATEYTFTMFGSFYVTAPGVQVVLRCRATTFIQPVNSYSWNIMRVK